MFARKDTRPPSSALLPFLFRGEGSPTKIDYRKKGTLVLTSLPDGHLLSPNSTCMPACEFFFLGRRTLDVRTL